MMVEQLRCGLPYRNFLAALFLAGIRDVSPHPPGFKFHCVFAIHSANQMSLDAVSEDRLLPLFWALDQFKKSQADNVRQGDFHMTKLTGPSAVAGKSGRRIPCGNAGLGRGAGGQGRRRLRALQRGRSDDRGPLEVRRSRFSQHRPQGDFRRQLLADSANNRLAPRGADHAINRHGPSRRGLGARQGERRLQRQGLPVERPEGQTRLAPASRDVDGIRSR